MHEREIEVRKVWLELYFLNKETYIMADRVTLFQEDLDYQFRLHESGVAVPEELSRSQSGLFDTRLSFHEAKRRFEEGVEKLALEAGLKATETVDMDTPPHLPELVLEGLDHGVLIASAVENSSDLGRLVAQSDVVVSTLEARKATRIPWLSVITASYDYEERYGGKYRDEYGVMVAFNLPVFSWLDKDLGAREQADLENLHKQRDLLEKRIEIKLKHALSAFERAQEDRITLRGQGRELRGQIQTQLEKIDTKEPAFQAAQMRMRRTLLDTHRLELHVGRSYARALLELEAVLGMPLNRVFKQDAIRPVVVP
jgi:outer membrane protein TolC